MNSLKQEKDQVLSNYQKTRHLKLLKSSKDLESLSNDEIYELSLYSSLLHEQLSWETQDHYLQFQQELLTNKITISEFCQLVHERDLLNGEVTDILESNFIVLSPHKKSVDFALLIHELLDTCYSYDPDASFGEAKKEQEKQFQNYIQRIYTELQTLLKE